MSENRPNYFSYILYSVSLLIIAIIIGVWIFFAGTRPSAHNPFGLLGDAFSLAGMFGLLAALMLYISKEGYFDIITYGLKRVFRASFDANYKKSMKQSYQEYKAFMQAKRKPAPVSMVIISCIYLFIGIVFIILFYTVTLS